MDKRCERGLQVTLCFPHRPHQEGQEIPGLIRSLGERVCVALISKTDKIQRNNTYTITHQKNCDNKDPLVTLLKEGYSKQLQKKLLNL